MTVLTVSEARAILAATKAPKRDGHLASARDKCRTLIEIEEGNERCVCCRRKARTWSLGGVPECGRCPWTSDAMSLVFVDRGGAILPYYLPDDEELEAA